MSKKEKRKNRPDFYLIAGYFIILENIIGNIRKFSPSLINPSTASTLKTLFIALGIFFFLLETCLIIRENIKYRLMRKMRNS